MKLSEFEKLEQNTRNWVMLQAVKARHGKNAYDIAIMAIAKQLHLSLRDAKRLSVSLYQQFLKTQTINSQYRIVISDLSMADNVLEQLNPFFDSLIPKNIPQKFFIEYLDRLKAVNSTYILQKLAENQISTAEYQILFMIYNNDLDDFFDRLFEHKEGYICSHDKTVSVLQKTETAILEHQNLKLISYFSDQEKPELVGKRTYWSTNVFKDTNEVIQFLTEHFYLS